MRRKATLAVLLATMGLVLLPWLTDHERTRLDDATRAGLRGPTVHAFAPLADGVTHYQRLGPKAARTVVLIHGVSGPMVVWDRTVDALAAAGLGVVRYDLYGRGYSDRPPAAYGLDLYQRQLLGLLDSLGQSAPVDLAGSSMGALVALRFARDHPGRVRRLVLVGPAGFPIQASPLARLTRAPWLGEYLMAVAGDRMLQAHGRRYFARPGCCADVERAFARQLEFKGTKRAILSTLREVPLEDDIVDFEAVGRQGRPVLLIWGTEDQTFPYANHTRALAALPGGELQTITGSAHLPQYESADVVNPLLVRFLSQP